MSNRKPMWHLTAMQHAFLIALTDWAARGRAGGLMTLPTGRVDSLELVRVVTALKCAKHYSTGTRWRRHQAA
jgi:hypothetical protein